MKDFVDLTAFLASPGRTGIQRVSGELCKHWDARLGLTPVRLTTDRRLVPLPPQTPGLIREYFSASGRDLAGLEDRLAEVGEQAESSKETIDLQPDCRVIVPELFYDPGRVAFFRSLSAEHLNYFYFIIYDLLPFTHPEFFVADAPQEIINGYTRVVRMARNVAFISSWTRDAYYRRLLRKTSSLPGPVLRLGSDGLGDRPSGTLSRSRRPKFTVIGTIEPRKNHALILEVFESLLHKIEGLQLVFLGQMGWVEPALAERIQSMAAGGCPGFEYHSSPSDDLIRQHVLGSWATIYISAAEGFGLPPVESLWLGTPVIASDAIPSLDAIGSEGVHIVDPVNEPNLKEAVLAFLEESYADRKRDEAMGLTLPTWQSFAREVTWWCTR
jgi:glycosyltransferase involved in cell wall biosynthesis